MKSLALGLVLILGSAAAVVAQTPPAAQTTPFACPAGSAGTDQTIFRGTSLTGGPNNSLHYVVIRFPPAGRCGSEAPLEGLADDNRRVSIEPTYAAVQPFSTTLAIARRTDGAHVFIDLATKAERPFPYIRFLSGGDIGAFGIEADDPATQTSTVVMLSPATGAPIARFERIIGMHSTENVPATDFTNRAVPLRQRTLDGTERVLWVNRSGALNRETAAVTELRGNSYGRELVEIVGPSPFPNKWPEMFVPLEATGHRWPLPAGVLGFAPHPLNQNDYVTFISRDGKPLIYTGATLFFSNPDSKRAWSLDKRESFYFEDMVALIPAQQPVEEYKTERFLVVRAPGAPGWKPLKMELPDPEFTRPTPQAALDEAIIAYNARMAAGGLAELNARRAAEKAASDKALAAWEAARAAEGKRYDALVKRAADPKAAFTNEELQFAFDHEASTFKSDFRYAAPKALERYTGLQLIAELRRFGTPHELSIRNAERRARDAGPEALRAFSAAYPALDPQSKVMLCAAGQQTHCYQPPASALGSSSGSGVGGASALQNATAQTDALIARERAVNASNCARASLGASIGCGQ